MKFFCGDATGEDGDSLSLDVSSEDGVRRNSKVFGSDANGEGDPLSLGVLSEEGAELGLVDGL